MKEFQHLNPEGQEDLRIVEHLDMQKLPESCYGVYRKIA